MSRNSTTQRDVTGKFVYFYAIGTIEDPDVSGGDHLDEILPHARQLGRFGLPSDAAGLLEFLRNPPPELPQAEPRAGRTPKVKSVSPSPHAPAPESGSPNPVEEGIWDGEIPERLRGIASVGRDSVDFYLKQIAQYELLTAEEEIELGRQIEQGVLARQRLETGQYQFRRERRELETVRRQGERAHQRFTCANLRLVVSIAKKQSRGAASLELLDRIQEGNLGLERAIQKWDYSRGLKFSTYATWWIRQSITRADADLSRAIRLPVHKVEELGKARRHFRAAMESHGDEVQALRDTAGAMEMTVEDARELFDLDSVPLSLDMPTWLIERGRVEPAAFGARLIDEFAEDVAVGYERALLREWIDDRLWELGSREEEVIRCRFGLPNSDDIAAYCEPMTLDMIGVKLGVTRERVRQIEVKAKKALRDILEFHGVGELRLIPIPE